MVTVTTRGGRGSRRWSLPACFAACVVVPWVPLLVSLVALGAYLHTLAPSISWANGVSDGGELAAAAYVLGIPHPTGYPLYMLLGWGISHLPFGEPARDLALFSAVCGALAAGLAAALAAIGHGGARAETGGVVGTARMGDCPDPVAACGPVVAGLVLAALPTFWVQATNPETRTLAALLVAAVLLALALYLRRGSPRLLLLAWAIEGLALADHLLCLAVVPALAVVTIITPAGRATSMAGGSAWGRARRTVGAGAALVPGLALYAYLPLRAAAAPALDWADPRTPRRFLWSVTGAQYRSLMGLAPGDVPGRLADRGHVLVDGLGPLGMLAGLAGLALLWRRWPRLALALALTVATAFAQSALYGAAAAPDYLIPAQLVLACGAGYLLCTASAAPAARATGANPERMPRGWTRPVRGLWAALAVVAGVACVGGEVSRHALAAGQDSQQGAVTARDYASISLRPLPRHALVLAQGDDQTFALWYAQFALQVRPDVAVVNTDLLAWQWYPSVLRLRYPWLRWTDVPRAGADQDLATDGHDARAMAREVALIRANVAHTPIFWTTPDGLGDAYCGIEPASNLFRCTPI